MDSPMGIPLCDEPTVWFLVGSLKAAVRQGYELARVSAHPHVIMFMPKTRKLPVPPEVREIPDEYYLFKTLHIRGFRFDQVDEGPNSLGVGYGNLMVYRVCLPRPPGWLATQAGIRGIEEEQLLTQLVIAGWKTTYQWIALSDLSPRRS